MKKVATVMVMILAMVVFSFEQVDGSDPVRDNQKISRNCFAECLISKCKAKSNDLSRYAACVDICGSKCHYTSCI